MLRNKKAPRAGTLGADNENIVYLHGIFGLHVVLFDYSTNFREITEKWRRI